MKMQNKRHPQQAKSAFMVIFFHAFIIGFIIQALIPFYWMDDLSTDMNLLQFAIFSGGYSFILSAMSSLNIYKTGSLPVKYILHIVLYSVFLIVITQTILDFSSSTKNVLKADVRVFIQTLALTFIIVMIMAYMSWRIWDRWRQTRQYD